MFNKSKAHEKYKVELRQALKSSGCEIYTEMSGSPSKDAYAFSELCLQVSEELTNYYPHIRVEIQSDGSHIHLGRDSLASPYWEKLIFKHSNGANFYLHHYKCINESPKYNVTSETMPIQEIVNPLNRRGVQTAFEQFEQFEDMKRYLINAIATYISVRHKEV